MARAALRALLEKGMALLRDDFGELLNRLSQASRGVLFHARRAFSSHPGTMIGPASVESALSRQLNSSGNEPPIPEHVEVPPFNRAT